MLVEDKVFFDAAVETILLLGCAKWSLTKAEEKSLDGSHTRNLRCSI